MSINQSKSAPTVIKTSFYSLIILALCACFIFYKYLLQTYPSVITQELMLEFNLTGAALGNLAATFYYSFLFTQIFAGILLDKFSVRFISASAILLCALGVLWFAYSKTSFEACLSRTLIGIGVAFTTVTYMKLASLWFAPKHYPLVTSLVATSVMLGVVAGQMPLAKLIASLGWRHSLSLIGVIGFVLAFLFLFIIRDYPSSSSSRIVTSSGKTSLLEDVLVVVKNKNNWLLMFYAGLVFSPLNIFCGLWGTPFLQEAYQLSKSESALMVSIAFVGWGIGSPILAMISSWLDNLRLVMIVSTIISCIALCFVLFSPHLSTVMLGIYLFIFGFCLGTYMLIFTAARAINPPHLTATVIAMINMGDIMTGVTEPIIGKILDFNWDGTIVNGVHFFSVPNYHFALTLLPLFLVLSTIIVFSAKNVIVGSTNETHIKSITV